MSAVQIVWFKRDLRSADHAALTAAAARGPVLPLFVVEPDYWQLPDVSARHYAFLGECLTSLRNDLARRGQPLIVRVGPVEVVLERARRRFGAIVLWSHEETGNAWTYERDKRVAHWSTSHGVVWHECRQNGVVRRLGSRDGWASRWDAFIQQPIHDPPHSLPPVSGIEPGDLPSPSDLELAPDICPERQRGGREHGLDCLHSFLHERGQWYRQAMSSPLGGAQQCSRISPHLAWGTLSIREVYHAVQARREALKSMNTKGWRPSLKSYTSRLHWRDHFVQKLEDQPNIERRHIHRAYDAMRTAEPPATTLHAWRHGETGLPFVDACMRSLQATGWINFRMRAMLMAVASYHLWLDWRKPGEHLARVFTDYEPGIHWPQVQMQSGTTGINTIRIYNPIKQGNDQDPTGEFVRTWIPALARVPDAFIHEPWRWSEASSLLEKTYPLPIVDHMEAARAARQKLWAVRDSDRFKDQAHSIVRKHASRKSGRGRARNVRPKAVSLPQLKLDLD
ncbi:MAG: FAD-binding domain-containing protein [Pseudomonadota bacterium]